MFYHNKKDDIRPLAQEMSRAAPVLKDTSAHCRMLLPTSGRNCLQRIKKNMKKWQGIIREWPSKYPNQVSNAPPFYVLDNIFNPSEWPLQQSEVISYMTFRCNFTELVVSEAMSSWHLQVKMELHRWQCHCFMYIICLQGLTSLC